MNQTTTVPPAIAVAAAFLTGGCGNHPTAPSTSQPSTTTAPATFTVTVSGFVQDNASRFLRDVRVEIVDGPGAGTFALTDEAGRYKLSGTFSGPTATFRATKDGYTAVTTNYAVTNGAGGGFDFTLKSPASPRDISGDYVLTFNADPACSGFPDDLKTRTYRATVRPRSTRPPNGPVAGSRRGTARPLRQSRAEKILLQPPRTARAGGRSRAARCESDRRAPSCHRGSPRAWLVARSPPRAHPGRA